MEKPMKKPIQILLLTGSFSAVFLSFIFLYFNMIGLEPAFYKAFFKGMISWSVVPQILVISLLAAWMTASRFRGSAGLSIALLPAWLLWGIPFFPLSFFSILIFIFLSMICLWRAAALGGWSFPAVIRERTVPMIVIPAALIGCLWGIYMQTESFDRLWFTFTDWTEYYQGYLMTVPECLKGRFWRILYNSGHFNPLPNILISPVIALLPFPQTLFALNSIFIYAAVPLAYAAARQCGIRRFPAGLLAMALMFHFTMPNLNLSLFYGFHPIVMFPMLLLLFFLFYRKGNRTGMNIMFILTLLLQETTAVFWFGWGLFLFLKKQYLKAVSLMCFSCIWFAFIVKLVMPAAKRGLHFIPRDADRYIQTFHYGGMGNSISEILFSPFTDPGIFFSRLFSPLNFYFILTLLLAFFPLALASWKLLFCAFPLLIGLFLMGGCDALNISMWYQTEIYTILVLAMISGYTILRRTRIPFPGIRTMKPPRIANGAVYACVLGMLLCGLFFGRLPFGKYSFSRIQERPDVMKQIQEIKNKLGSKKDLLLVTPQIRIHFFQHYRTENIMRMKPPFKAPFVLLHLDDLHVDYAKNQALSESMRKDPDYMMIYECRERGCNLELYARKQTEERKQ